MTDICELLLDWDKSGEAPPQLIDHREFVLQFLQDNKSLLRRCIYKRMIPNRYAPSDVQAYIIERILEILQKRKAKGRPIREPALYFRKLIDYYCIEFQRMHGFIYGMPKRPRNTDAEQEIAKYGFVYFPAGENSSLDNIPQLGYIDINVTVPEHHDRDFVIKGEDPGIDSEPWEKLMQMALPEDQEVLTCVFKHNMSIPEASRYLGIAVSTAYQRKERGVKAISGTLATYVDLDKKSWEILDEVEGLSDNQVDVTQFFQNR